MSYKHEDEIDMNLFASVLQDAVTKVKTEENPEVLNDLKKAYKQNVPFSLRIYVAAYLAKKVLSGTGKSSSRARREVRENRSGTSRDWKTREPREKNITEQPVTAHRSEQKEHARTPKVQIDESLATTIFIGIGRNRRVYPRDLVGLLVSVAGLDRDRIGDIRVLANYSFVQLFTEDADKAISTLNGYDYRGRKLSVSFSRQKDETAPGDADDKPSQNEETTEKKVSHEDGVAAGLSAAEDAAAYAAAEKAAADKEPFSIPVSKTFDASEPAEETHLV